jgi:hypothetical protein
MSYGERKQDTPSLEPPASYSKTAVSQSDTNEEVNTAFTFIDEDLLSPLEKRDYDVLPRAFQQKGQFPFVANCLYSLETLTQSATFTSDHIYLLWARIAALKSSFEADLKFAKFQFSPTFKDRSIPPNQIVKKDIEALLASIRAHQHPTPPGPPTAAASSAAASYQQYGDIESPPYTGPLQSISRDNLAEIAQLFVANHIPQTHFPKARWMASKAPAGTISFLMGWLYGWQYDETNNSAWLRTLFLGYASLFSLTHTLIDDLSLNPDAYRQYYTAVGSSAFLLIFICTSVIHKYFPEPTRIKNKAFNTADNEKECLLKAFYYSFLSVLDLYLRDILTAKEFKDADGNPYDYAALEAQYLRPQYTYAGRETPLDISDFHLRHLLHTNLREARAFVMAVKTDSEAKDHPHLMFLLSEMEQIRGAILRPGLNSSVKGWYCPGIIQRCTQKRLTNKINAATAAVQQAFQLPTIPAEMEKQIQRSMQAVYPFSTPESTFPRVGLTSFAYLFLFIAYYIVAEDPPAEASSMADFLCWLVIIVLVCLIYGGITRAYQMGNTAWNWIRPSYTGVKLSHRNMLARLAICYDAAPYFIPNRVAIEMSPVAEHERGRASSNLDEASCLRDEGYLETSVSRSSVIYSPDHVPHLDLPPETTATAQWADVDFDPAMPPIVMPVTGFSVNAGGHDVLGSTGGPRSGSLGRHLQFPGAHPPRHSSGDNSNPSSAASSHSDLPRGRSTIVSRDVLGVRAAPPPIPRLGPYPPVPMGQEPASFSINSAPQVDAPQTFYSADGIPLPPLPDLFAPLTLVEE